MTDVVAGLRALSTEIDRLDDIAAEHYGLNRTDMRGLDLIGQRGAMAPSELARLLGFTTGGVTTVIDRLERAGYVRRVPDPRDRRRLLIEATDTTTARDAAVFGPLVQNTRALLNSYDDAQLAIIKAFLDQTSAITAAHADALHQHDPEPASTTGDRAARRPSRRDPAGRS